jgi:tetratricopeptide (TPR) repeat protein
MRLFYFSLLLSYVLVIIPFTSYLKNRPVAVKLGYTPEAEVLKMVAGDQRYLVADYTVLKVLFYYGTLAERWQNKIKLPPEYFNMFKTLETAVKLDPYNMDAYYFSQAAFTWEVGRAKDVNRLLMYGMKYRPWDHNLPFYIGFNSAYFLKDYENAAKFMQKAAEISGEPLYTGLAARYFYEAGHTELGIIFLAAMEKGAKDRQIRDVYALRKKALLAVKTLEKAVEEFRSSHRRLPGDLSELVSAGILRSLPVDPYGGNFFVEADGRIRSTSKFAFGRENK